MKKKILMVDDDAVFSDVLKEVLEMEGYSLIAITQVGDIVSVTKDLQPDLVLLDYKLRGANGGELCRNLKSCPELEPLPVLLLSAYSKDHLPLDTIPFSVFISKPFDLWEFLNCIRELMQPVADTEK